MLRAGLALLAAAVIAGAWAVRMPVAERVMKAAASAAGYDVAFKVTALDFGQVAANEVRLGPPDAPDVEAAVVRLQFRLSEVLSGRIRGLEVETATVRVGWDDGRLRFAGRRPPWEGPPARLRLADVRVLADTPFGLIEADVNADGDRATGWRVEATARTSPDPADAARIVIEDAALTAVLTPEDAHGSLALVITEANAPAWRLGPTVVSGDFQGALNDPEDWDTLTGEGVLTAAVEGAGFEADAATRVAQAFAPPPRGAGGAVIAPHLQEARFALESALRAFGGSADIGFRLQGSRVDARLNAPLKLAGASGARFDIRMSSRASAQVDLVSGEATLRRFRARLRGEGLPRVTSRIGQMEIKPKAGREPWLYADADLSVDPWDVAGVSAGMELDLLRLTVTRREWRVAAAGRAAVDGARGGAALRGVGLAADLEIVGRDGVVSVTPRAGAVARATVQDATLAGVAFRDVSMHVRPAPAGRPLVSWSSEGLGVAATVRDLDFLAARPELGARLRALAVEVVHDRPVAGELAWRLRVQGPRVDGRLADGGRVRMDARVIDASWLNQTPPPQAANDAAAEEAVEPEVSGAAEARVTFETLSINAEKGLASVADAAGEVVLTMRDGAPATGRATLARALVRDQARVHRVAPLRVSVAAEIDGSQIAGLARAALADSGDEVVQADVAYDLAEGAGSARYATPVVTVGRGRLGVADVSPIMGLAARGMAGALQAQGDARFRLRPDPRSPVALEAMTLRLNISDVDVNTPLGRLDGVKADLAFSDLVRPRTDGVQTITAEAYTPGVPLTQVSAAIALADGLVSGDPVTATLAGGEVALEPLEVDIAGRAATGLIAVRRLDLAALTQAANLPGVEMTGLVSGGGYIEAAPLSLRFDNVRLAALGPGVVTLGGDAAPLAADVGDNAGEALGAEALQAADAGEDDAQAGAPDAVEDPGPPTPAPFAYDRMEVSLDGDVRAVTLVVEAWPRDDGAPRRETMVVDLSEILRAAPGGEAAPPSQ